jgi:Flp pilus assembly protein TadG
MVKALKQALQGPSEELSMIGQESARHIAARHGLKNRQALQGAAVIEFALILPLLLLLLIGGIDMSLALYDKAVITNASREGARAGIVAVSYTHLRAHETN